MSTGFVINDGSDLDTRYVRTVNGVSVDTNGNVKVDVGGAVAVGTVIAMAANSNPDGYLLCNGGAVSRTTYAALFAKIGTTYGTGDGSSTFNVPNLTDKFIQGSGTAGTVKSAGLPNLSGYVGGWYSGGQDGKLFVNSGGSYDSSTGSGTNYTWGRRYNFNASNYNSIYGASSTVQPPALTMRFYIKF